MSGPSPSMALSEPRSEANANGTARSFRAHEHLDGVRGVLMSLVLAIHIFYASVSSGIVHLQPWYHWVTVWFQPGIYTVGLFVVISGYSLMLPVIGAGGQLRGGLGRYYRRRATRIVLPYYLALGFSLLHVVLFPWQYQRLGIPADVLKPGILWSHLLLFYNFKPAWTFAINSPYWSLAPEWDLYLLFPILFVPLWKKFGSAALLGCASVITVALVFCGDRVTRMHPWYIFLFACGMAGSVVAGSADEASTRLRRSVPWGSLSLALFGGSMLDWILLLWRGRDLLSYMPPVWWLYCVNETVLGLAILCAILYWSRIQETRTREAWPGSLRFFHHRWVKWVGSFSYSHYLIHFPVVVGLAAVLRSLHLAEPVTLVLGYLLISPVSIGVAYLFFMAVERRTIPGFRREAAASPSS